MEKTILTEQGSCGYASPRRGCAPHRRRSVNIAAERNMKLSQIALMTFTKLVISSMCFGGGTLHLPNPQALSQCLSDPITIMTKTNGGGIMPDSIFLDMSSGVVAAISFNYKAGIGFDKAYSAVGAYLSNRPGKIASKALPQYAVWVDFDERFSLIVHGGTNQATVTLQSIAPGTMEYILSSQRELPVGSNDHNKEASEAGFIAKSSTNDLGQINNTEQGAGVVREPRGGSRAPQP